MDRIQPRPLEAITKERGDKNAVLLNWAPFLLHHEVDH
jgi:hypothetical protein